MRPGVFRLWLSSIKKPETGNAKLWREIGRIAVNTIKTLCAVLVAGLFMSAWTADAASGRGRKKAAKDAEIKPSVNKGRRGQYTVKTGFPGNNYHVYVPKTYSDDNPAGIHLYFAGQGGCRKNTSFHRWARYFLEPYNLIGINMQYLDGDNAKETDTKFRAAFEAVMQVQADYKIIVGRGAISSFSGGGLPHGYYFNVYGHKGDKPTPEWPFNHVALYSSNYRGMVVSRVMMTGFVGVGGKEWNLAALGATQSARARDLLSAWNRDKCADAFFNLMRERGHTIPNEDVERSAAQFHRSDLAFCPFLYAADYKGTPLAKIVANANRLKLGRAVKALDKLLARDGLDAGVKGKAEKVKAKIDKRVRDIAAVCRELAENDHVLLAYYGPMYLKQIAGVEGAGDVKTLVKPVLRKKKKLLKLRESFVKAFGGSMSMSVSDDKAEALRKIRDRAGAKSTIGQMIARLLDIKD